MAYRKQATPSMMVDWRNPIRHAIHRVPYRRGERQLVKVPVFRGVDLQISMKMHQEAQRHARGRWAGSRYAKRNEFNPSKENDQ